MFFGATESALSFKAFGRCSVAITIFMACIVRVNAEFANNKLSEQIITRAPDSLEFPRHYWDPEIRANLLVLEFLRSDWEQLLKVDHHPRDDKKINEEIQYLFSLIRLRDERRDEIKAQHEYSFLPYFFSIVMMNQWSHPRTYELMNFANGVGLIVFAYKQRFNRARPAQLAPGLYPTIVTPGHPSYPSGHAFQSRLVALILAELRPDARSQLIGQADRISINREIAGVHYPSDSTAGKALADQVFILVKRGAHFQALMEQARAEW